MSDFPRVRITGGPLPSDVTVVDVETGKAIEYVIDATWHCAPGELATVTLTLPAEVDVVGESLTHRHRAALETILDAATIREPIESPINRLAGIAEEARIALGIEVDA